MAAHSDPTFRTYLPSQAASYAASRLSYPSQLYEHVLQRHARTGGSFEVLLDVGCGPGNATRDVAQAFNHAVGVDPGAEMINEAKRLGGETKIGEKVDFEVIGAESCAKAKAVATRKVDLLISAMAAHWFDMPEFWKEAAQVVKPGGTVALWTIASNYAHPGTHNAQEVNRILLQFERETLAPFEAPGNRLSRDMYDNLPLPWDADPSQTAFPREQFHRDEWDRDGVLTGAEFFGDEPKATSLEDLKKGLGTASMVSRWREAHPDLVGTDRDCVHILIEDLKQALGKDADKGIRTCGSTAILFFKRA